MAFSLGEYQDIFLEEADEQLQELNQNLLRLEKNPEDIEIINNIFRAAHSLKSSAAFVGLNNLSDLAHKMENLLQGIRDKTMQVTPPVVDVLFNCFDVISAAIDTVGAGEKPEEDFTEIMSRIDEIASAMRSGSGFKGRPSEKNGAQEEKGRTALTPRQMKQIKEGLQSGLSCCEVTVYIDPSAPMKALKAQLIGHNMQRIGTIVASDPDIEMLTEAVVGDVLRVVLLTSSTAEDVRKCCEIDLVTRADLKRISLIRKDDKMMLRFHGKETIYEEEKDAYSDIPGGMPDEMNHAADYDDDDEQYHIEAVKRKDDKRGPALKIVKVSVDKLDQLLNNVGELVIANSGFFRLYEDLRRSGMDKSITNEFKNRMDQMSRIAKDLQGGIMKTRMVPIGQVFSRFNRLVRDLAKEFGKSVMLEIKGEDTELDKKVIDVIGEPLMHLIRNSIDHGIESPEERLRLKKSETATLTLNAYQSGNQIFVLVSDDGRGLDAAKIRKKALDRGLATAEVLSNMDNEDVYNFLYVPGFSTTDIVTDISGRGVGMNVVKEIVSELNGSVSIETEPGMGTRFILTFPLTLAIIPAIMVRVQRELYAIPLSDVIETIKIAPSDVTTIEGHEVINLRGEILSLLRLNEFVGIESAIENGKKVPVVVVGYGNRKIGLIVDYLEGKQEIVIKSLEQNYTTVEGLAGASILGDGSICLILDIASMINKVINEQDRLSRGQRQKIMQAKEAEIEQVVPAPEKAAGRASTDEKAKPVVIEKEAKPALAVKAVEAERPTVLPERKPAEPAFSAGAAAAQRPVVEVREEIKEEVREEVKEDIVFSKIAAEQKPAEAAPAGEASAQEEIEPSEDDAAIEAKVRDLLKSFKDELKETVRQTMDRGEADDHMKKSLQISDDDIDKVQVLANVGIANAAESLSKILDKRIDLSIPDVMLMPVEKIPETVGAIDNVYIGVYMPLVGDIKGTILFALQDTAGFELIDMLYGIESGMTNQLDEDGESALREVTNIVGSSVVNVFSEKTGIAIKPTVPTIVHDYMQSILDSILVVHTIVNDYALVMDTEFYYQDDKVIGKLLILPETESLKKIVKTLD